MPFQHDLIRCEAAARLRKGLSESHECTAEFRNRHFRHIETKREPSLSVGLHKVGVFDFPQKRTTPILAFQLTLLIV